MKNACIVVKKCLRIMILMTFFEIYVLFARFFDVCFTVSGRYSVLSAEVSFECVCHV